MLPEIKVRWNANVLLTGSYLPDDMTLTYCKCFTVIWQGVLATGEIRNVFEVVSIYLDGSLEEIPINRRLLLRRMWQV
jgi:hypothetical protein